MCAAIAATAIIAVGWLWNCNIDIRFVSSLTIVSNVPPLQAQKYCQYSKLHKSQILNPNLLGSFSSSFPLIQSTKVATRRQVSDSSTSSYDMKMEGDDDDIVGNLPKPLRMLALHGSGGTGTSLLKTLQHWNTNMNRSDLRTQQQLRRQSSNKPTDDQLSDGNDDSKSYVKDDNELKLLDITTITGHVPKEDGFCWWKLGPGERSFNADHYNGFEESQSLVLNALMLQQEPNKAPYDIIFGHSQGAILLTALLALDSIVEHPTIGYIFNGVAWPNPYSLELESVQLRNKKNQAIRILILIGERDRINPPEQAYRVVSALRNAGCDVTVIVHPNGHSIPIELDMDSNNMNDDTTAAMTTWEAIQHWMLFVRRKMMCTAKMRMT
jgi:predicted esterase